MGKRTFSSITDTILWTLLAVAVPVFLWWAIRESGHSGEERSGASAETTREAPQTRTAAARAPESAPTTRVVSEPFVEGQAFGSLLVRVVWADDKKPAADIRCTVLPAARTNADLEGRRFVTGPDGTFRAEPLPSGRVELRFDVAVKATADVKPGVDNETTVELPAGATVEGVVVDDKGNGVPDAALYVGYHDSWIFAPDAFFQDPPSGRSGADGKFVIRLPREEKTAYDWIGARATGFAPSPTQVLYSKRGAVFQVRLTLGGPGGGIAGRVTDAARRPIRRATVVAGQPNGDAQQLRDGTFVMDRDAFRATTDDEGRFAIAGVRPGSTKIEARAPGFAWWSGSVDVAVGEKPATVEIALNEGAVVSGTVVDEDGRAISGAAIQATKPVGGLGVSRAVSDADGKFRLEALTPGPVELSAYAEGRGLAMTKLELAADTESRWNAVLSRGRSLHGRVVDADDAPLAGWKLRAFRTDGRGPPQYLDIHQAVTDASGTFSIGNLDDAAYNVLPTWAQTRSTVPEAAAANVRPGGPEIVIRIPNPPSAFITGVVVDPDDKPVGGAMVSLWTMPLPTQLDVDLTEGGTGRFKIGPVIPKAYGVEVGARGFAATRIPPQSVEAGATLDLGTVKVDRPGYLIAHFKREDGAEVTGLDVRVLGLRPYADMIRRDGNTARATLAAGKYRLFVSAKDVVGTETPFEIRPGLDSLVGVMLRPGVERIVTFTIAPDAPRPTSLHIILRDAEGKVVRELDTIMFLREKGHWYPSLLPGTWRVEAKTDNGLKASGTIVVKDLTPSEEPIDFKLE